MPLPKQLSDSDLSSLPSDESDDEQAVGTAPVVTGRNFVYMRPDAFRRGEDTFQNPTYITTSQVSPVKASASNPAAGQEQTRAAVDKALKDELGGARILADDLIDQMFGSIIPLDLATRVLEGLLQAGKVAVFDPQKRVVEDTTAALEDACAHALSHCRKRDGVEVVKTPKKGKAAEDTWKWRWKGYPTSVVESEMADYFNEIIDAAMALPCLADLLKERQALYRFALPYDTKHGFPLAHGLPPEDMRPDLIVLPLTGLHVQNPATPEGAVRYRADEMYSNFTMIRLSGECKKTDYNASTTQVQRYMRGTRRSQPWQRFITAMNVTQKTVGFMRGESTGIERVFLELEYGRSSLEFVRLLLGIALADEETFGKSRHFELSQEDMTLQSSALESQGTAAATSIPAPTEPRPEALRRSARIGKRDSRETDEKAVKLYLYAENSGAQDHETTAPEASSQPHQSAKVAIGGSGARASRSSQKRKRTDDDDEYIDLDTAPPRKKRSTKEALYTVQVPKKAFGYDLKGLLFNAASIRGRGTVVWAGQKDGGKLVAVKISWQDVARRERRDKVLRILANHEAHGNILYPTALSIEEDSTLRTIRAFSSDEVKGWAALHEIEDRVLEVHVIDLARPVMFFWSIPDFILGLRGALLGHEYLVQIGILHRDVSENNILLALYPGAIRGYITDFDMAIPYQMPASAPEEQSRDFGKLMRARNAKRSQASNSTRTAGPFKAERTGTTPYMSINVLNGLDHTHYDDIESFFYVLVLFFMTYKHPLPVTDLRDAQSQGYTQGITNARRPHITGWPNMFRGWEEGNSSDSKSSFLHSGKYDQAFMDAVEQRWENKDVAFSIGDLIASCVSLFNQVHGQRRVSHQEFIAVLDAWLKDNRNPPEGYNSCPHSDPKNKPLV